MQVTAAHGKFQFIQEALVLHQVENIKHIETQLNIQTNYIENIAPKFKWILLVEIFSSIHYFTLKW